MKRLVFGNLQMIVAVLVLGAITASLLLPSPPCTPIDVNAPTAAASAQASNWCLPASAVSERGMREP